MSKGFILTTDELFGSYCYIEQKRYGVPNEKFLYKIIGKFTSNAWSNVPVDVNDKEPHIFNHSEEVVNVVCCGVCEDKIERYKLSDVEIISNKDRQLADLEAKLAEYEKFMKDNEWDSVEEMQETLNKCEKKYFDIQKQLAESENQCRECKHLNKKIELNIKNKLMAENCKLQSQLAEKEKQLENAQNLKAIEVADELSLKLSKIHNQDKISFAIEQIIKTKETLIKFLQDEGFYENEWYDLFDKIDNQIKQLKEGK